MATQQVFSPRDLGLQGDDFPVIADALIQHRPLGSDEGHVVLHPLELAVMGHEAVKGIGLTGDQLDMQASLGVAFRNFGLQGRDRFTWDRFVQIIPHGVPVFPSLPS